MAQLYAVLIQEKPAQDEAVIFWDAYRHRKDAVAKCEELARYQSGQHSAAQLTKLTSPVVDLDTGKAHTNVDGYQVTADGFTGKYTVSVIRAIRE
ncbi:hypothetical protein [uncultured Limosilactobacillus sp.]|uniref:hypothetical protein n=1 Tax=uncultured Limosilactobacillus sp. TaxID=2837629 RepID=UPI0025F21999|nr:hypothetical protein [uncultured Limosilactobacillus sp.]